MQRAIDYDRPTIIKIVQELGMEVFMYKDAPGEFWSAHGKPVPKELAARAGYDIEMLERKRIRNERLAKAADALDRELNMAEASEAKRVLATYGEYKVISLGNSGYHQVEDGEGNNLTPGQTLPEQMARTLAMSMSGNTKENPPVRKPQGQAK